MDLEVDSAGSLYLPLQINGISVTALVDSGSTVSVIHPEVLERVTGDPVGVLDGTLRQIKLADGGLLETRGSAWLNLGVAADEAPFQHEMVVADVDAPAVIGLDFMHGHGCTLDVAGLKLIFGGQAYPETWVEDMPALFKITVAETAVIPLEREKIIPHKVMRDAGTSRENMEDGSLNVCRINMVAAPAKVNPRCGSQPLGVVDLDCEPQIGHNVGSCETCDSGRTAKAALSSEPEEAHGQQELIRDNRTILDSDKKLMALTQRGVVSSFNWALKENLDPGGLMELHGTEVVIPQTLNGDTALASEMSGCIGEDGPDDNW